MLWVFPSADAMRHSVEGFSCCGYFHQLTLCVTPVELSSLRIGLVSPLNYSFLMIYLTHCLSGDTYRRLLALIALHFLECVHGSVGAVSACGIYLIQRLCWFVG